METAKYQVSTGDIKFSSMTAKNLELKTTTGHITLDNVNVAEKITCNLDTGKAQYNNVKCENLSHKSSTGKAIFTNAIVNEHLEINTSTGDVKFTDSDAKTLYIKTSTGDVKGNLLTAHHFVVTSDTGKPNYPKYSEGGICEIITDTGDIDITAPNE